MKSEKHNSIIENIHFKSSIANFQDSIGLQQMQTNYLSFLKNGMLREVVPQDRKVVITFPTIVMALALQDAFEGKMVNTNSAVLKVPHHIRKAFILPPGTFKTKIATVLYSLWLLGKNNNEKIRIIVNGEDLERNIMTDLAKIANSETYKKVFPDLTLHITQKEISVVDDLGVKQNGVISIHTFQTSIPAGIDATTIIFDDFNSAGAGKHGLAEDQIKKTPENYSTATKRLRRGQNLDGTRSIVREIIVQQTLDQNDITGYIRQNFAHLWDIYCMPARLDNFTELVKTNNLPIYKFAQTRTFVKDGEKITQPIWLMRKTKMLCDDLFNEHEAEIEEKLNPHKWRLQYQQDISGGQEGKVFQEMQILNAHDTLLNNEAFCLTKEQIKEKMEIIIACDPSHLKDKNGDSFGIVVLGYYKPNINDPKPSQKDSKHISYGLPLTENVRELKPYVYFLEDRTIHASTTTKSSNVKDRLIKVCQEWNPSKIIYENNICEGFAGLYADCLPYCKASSIEKLFVAYRGTAANSVYKVCNDHMWNLYNNGTIKHVAIYKTTQGIQQNNTFDIETEMKQMSEDDKVRKKQSNDIISAFSWGFYYFYEKYFAKVKNNNNVIKIHHNYQLSDSVRTHYFL